jgi:hypothetical protein
MQYLQREHGEYMYKQSILSGIPAENILLIGHQTPSNNQWATFVLLIRTLQQKCKFQY